MLLFFQNLLVWFRFDFFGGIVEFFLGDWLRFC